MGWGVPEAGQQCYNSPMNSDLSERKEKKAKMPFLGRTLGRGPTKICILGFKRILIASLMILTHQSLPTSKCRASDLALWVGDWGRARIFWRSFGAGFDWAASWGNQWYVAHLCVRDDCDNLNLSREIPGLWCQRFKWSQISCQPHYYGER